MNNKLIPHTLSTLRIIAISSLTIFTLYTLEAWTGPIQSAPNGNVGGPLTTSSLSQIKDGSLGLTGTLITGGLQLLTGAASGTVLTSDEFGNASWATSTKVIGSCVVGQAITAINADGTVTCGTITTSFASATSRTVEQTWGAIFGSRYVSCNADEAITSCTYESYKCGVTSATISGKSCGNTYWNCTNGAGTTPPSLTIRATCVK